MFICVSHCKRLVGDRMRGCMNDGLASHADRLEIVAIKTALKLAEN
jgi:hypothetical protein